jgi:hypothetical protein
MRRSQDWHRWRGSQNRVSGNVFGSRRIPSGNLASPGRAPQQAQSVRCDSRTSKATCGPMPSTVTSSLEDGSTRKMRENGRVSAHRPCLSGQAVRNERALADRRREAGLCLHRAAARLRISTGYLRSLERGHTPLSFPLAERMAQEYGTTIRDLTRPAGAGGTGPGGRRVGTPPAR